jgi:cytochrome c553
MPSTPALAGQHMFYAITQLFLFREGRRNNEAMTAVAKGMSDADMQGFANVIARCRRCRPRRRPRRPTRRA